MLVVVRSGITGAVVSVVTWPLWWYSRGLALYLRRRIHSLHGFEESIGLTVWVVNWGKPMYGQYDVTGYVISFLVRTVGIIFKILQLLIYTLGQLVLIVLWLGLPLLILIELSAHLLGTSPFLHLVFG